MYNNTNTNIQAPGNPPQSIFAPQLSNHQQQQLTSNQQQQQPFSNLFGSTNVNYQPPPQSIFGSQLSQQQSGIGNQAPPQSLFGSPVFIQQQAVFGQQQSLPNIYSPPIQAPQVSYVQQQQPFPMGFYASHQPSQDILNQSFADDELIPEETSAKPTKQ